MKNGAYNVFQSIGKCYRYADGSPRIYAGIFINVTEAEREASDINGRLDALIGGVNGGLAICNNDPDYTYYLYFIIISKENKTITKLKDMI